MSATQSIIVYRNPLEQMFWEGAMAGNLWPVIVGIFVFFLVFGCLQAYVVDRFVPFFKRGRYTNLALLAGAVAGVGTIVYMVG